MRYAIANDIKNMSNKNSFKEKLKSIKDAIMGTSFKKGTIFDNNKDSNYSYF